MIPKSTEVLYPLQHSSAHHDWVKLTWCQPSPPTPYFPSPPIANRHAQKRTLLPHQWTSSYCQRCRMIIPECFWTNYVKQCNSGKTYEVIYDTTHVICNMIRLRCCIVSEHLENGYFWSDEEFCLRETVSNKPTAAQEGKTGLYSRSMLFEFLGKREGHDDGVIHTIDKCDKSPCLDTSQIDLTTQINEHTPYPSCWYPSWVHLTKRLFQNSS